MSDNSPLIPGPLLPDEDEELPEELIGNLDDDDNQLSDIRDEVQDRLRQSFKKEKTPEQRQLEQIKQRELHQKEVERSKALADKLKANKQVAQKVANTGANQTAAKQAEQRAAGAARRSLQRGAQAAGDAAKKAAQQAAKAAGQAIKKIVLSLVEKNPYVWLAVGIILLVVIIVLLIVALFSFSGQGGKGYPQYPKTQAQQEQATLLAALSGDKIANDKVTKEVINDEKDRYQRIKANAAKYSPADSVAIEAKIKEFNPTLDTLLTTQAKTERLKIRDDLQKKMFEFEQTLPFGSWISQIALGHLKQGSLTFCVVTGASANVACASFVSTVMWEAGVPNAIVPTTTQVWSNKSLQLIVDRPAAKSADTWSQNKDRLKPGDIIWWGDGTCSKTRYEGKLFDHVGIYVGDGEAVDNSSNKEQILKRGAESRSKCLLFNGAKRYGTN